MPNFILKIISLLLIFIGEGLAIYGETLAAKKYEILSSSFGSAFFKNFVFILIGSAFLIAGYMLGLKAFKNIWIVSAVSIASILIVEPFLNLTVIGHTPTTGALIGFILGIIGLIVSIVF